MEKVKIKNIKSGAIEEVKKEIAGDFLGTGEWELENKKEEKKPIFSANKEDK